VIYRLYERMLRKGLTTLPEHLCFMITEQDVAAAPGKLCEVIGWCSDLGIERVIVHISTEDPAHLGQHLPAIMKIADTARLNLHYGDRVEVHGKGMDVTVAVGKGGREEITGCIRKMGEAGVRPEDVTEDLIESYLTFKYEPDLVIKTGSDHLTDFLIWQSVYSEFFFLDINWVLLRKVDFLRALRDFQSRVRRFGA